MTNQVRAAIIALAALLAATAVSAQSRLQSDTALASVVAADRAFARQSLEKGMQAALEEFMAADAFMYRPKMVKARTYLEKRPTPLNLVLTWEPTFADVSRAGDLGFTTGPWFAQMQLPSGPPTYGQHVRIWRRQKNGAWKAEVDAGIAHDGNSVGPKDLRFGPAPAYRGAAAASAAAKKSLLDADAALAAIARKEGALVAFTKYRATDLRVLRNGQPPLTGDAALARMRNFPQYVWKPVAAAVARSADLGYTYGVYAMPGEKGDYLRVWRRDAAGAWKIVIDLTSAEF